MDMGVYKVAAEINKMKMVDNKCSKTVGNK